MGFAIDKIRADFPILLRQVHNKPLIYFDNAATIQNPQRVMDALVHFSTYKKANIHGGVMRFLKRRPMLMSVRAIW